MPVPPHTTSQERVRGTVASASTGVVPPVEVISLLVPETLVTQVAQVSVPVVVIGPPPIGVVVAMLVTVPVPDPPCCGFCNSHVVVPAS